jgi:hypothetical protein
MLRKAFRYPVTDRMMGTVWILQVVGLFFLVPAIFAARAIYKTDPSSLKLEAIFIGWMMSLGALVGWGLGKLLLQDPYMSQK